MGVRVGLCNVLFEDCSAFTCVTACTLAKSPEVIRYIEGFSYFVTSITAPIATGWNKSYRVGLAPTEIRRLRTAHTHSIHSWGSNATTRYVVQFSMLEIIWSTVNESIRGRDSSSCQLARG